MDLDVKCCEKVIVAQATGVFASAAVLATRTIGAQIVAIGRNLDALEKLKALSPDWRIRAV